jgi:hypothetical protein
MYLIGTLIWLFLSGLLTWLIALALTRWTRWRQSKLLRWGMALLLLPVVFMAPLADEIIGKIEFDRLCDEAKEVRIYGTAPVGEEFYTSDGKWRMNLRGEDAFQLNRLYKSKIRSESGGHNPDVIPTPIPIWKYHTKLYERENNRLLAEWDQFGTSGGWLSRNFELPFLVRSQCMPTLVQHSQLEQRLLPFAKTSEASK